MGKTVRNDNDYVRNAKNANVFVPRVRERDSRAKGKQSIKKSLMKEFG